MSNMTSLHAAARNGNAELVQDILEGRNGQAKVSINSQNSTGQTAMHLAAKWSRLNVIKLLIEAGADMEIKDRRGRTPFHEANDLISETAGLDSTIKKTQMDVMKSSIAARAFQIKQSGKNNDITTHEMEDALERLEAEHVWPLLKIEEGIEASLNMEAANRSDFEHIAKFMHDRPIELRNEQYDAQQKILRKREKQESIERAEQKRLQEVAKHEARRAAEKERAERQEIRELQRERICGKCGQTYTNEKNRGGQCVHAGHWTNWGTNNRGEKIEWLFYWTCCKSKRYARRRGKKKCTRMCVGEVNVLCLSLCLFINAHSRIVHRYEGPANGMSCCSRSDGHEESQADIIKRAQKQRQKAAAGKDRKKG